MVVIFIILPLGLPIIGVSQLDSLAIAILGTGILTNSYLTKLGFNVGRYQENPIYGYTRKFLTPERFILVAAVVEAAVGLALFVVVSDSYIVLLIALYALCGVIFQSIELATR